MASLVLRSARGLALGRGAVRMRMLSAAVELKGVGQASDLADVTLDGAAVIKMTPVTDKVSAHAALPSLPPKMTVNWDALMADLDDDAKKEVFAVKAIVDREQREIDQKRAELAGAANIDWDSWSKELSSPNAQKLLQGFKAELEGWTFDPSAANAAIDQYRADLKEMESLIAAEKVKLRGEIEMLKEQEAALEARMANVKNITIAQLMEEDPEMAMEVEEEIRNDHWSP